MTLDSHALPPPPPAADRPGGLSTGTLMLLLVWPLIVAAAAGVWLEQRRSADAAGIVEDRPRVVVLNEADFVRVANVPGTPQAQAQAGLRAADDAAAKLANSGYVVLRANAILRAPEGAWVKPVTP